METRELLELALGCGFDHVGELNVGALKFMPEVREMCASGRCQRYGTRWSCPPGCGTLEEAAERASGYRRGVLVQSTAEMEDDFDYPAMEALGRVHKERFYRLVEAVRREYPGCLPMGAGGCSLCEECTYPDAPCRYPDKAIPSMEAHGLMVSQVCEDSGVEYHYGRRTMTYTCCVLVD